MKTILFLALSFALSAQAKLNDFNSLIEENSRAQSELHTDLKQNLEDTQVAVQVEKKDRFVIDTAATVNVPTRKSFLTYKKNKTDYSTTTSESQKRLAQELDLAD